MGSAAPVAVYLRVSTDQQHEENQRPDIEELARARGLQITHEYAETVSTRRARPEFRRMMHDAHQGKFKVLLIWSIDRFGRSMIENMVSIVQLDRAGVRVVSCKQPWLDTEGPNRWLLIAVFSWAAENERQDISNRTKAGLARALREGKRLGRRRIHIDARVAEALRTSSIRKVAQQYKIKRSTLTRWKKQNAAAYGPCKGTGEKPENRCSCHWCSIGDWEACKRPDAKPEGTGDRP